MSNPIEYVNSLRNNRIEWKKEDKTYADLNTQIEKGRFNLNPEHQRHVVHNDRWKSEVLHSQIFHGDIPDVYFHPTEQEDGTRIYDSLDGKQRCSAIYDYLNDKFIYKIDEPKFMKNKKFSQLHPAFQSFLKDDCSITIRISNRTLTKMEIQSFFQKRQNFKKTSGGEHLNSCITSRRHDKVKQYIENQSNIEKLEKAGFKKNDRFQYMECVSYILRVFTNYEDTDIECSPSRLKTWFNNDSVDSNYDMEFKLVDITLELLNFIKVRGGNSRKNAYISCAWYIRNYCFQNNDYNMNKIALFKRDIDIELPQVGGEHSNKKQRLAFKQQIENYIE